MREHPGSSQSSSPLESTDGDKKTTTFFNKHVLQSWIIPVTHN